MRIPSELEGARVNVSRAAELAVMHPSHFRRLVRRGVMPQPRHTSKGMPFYDHSLLLEIAAVLRTGVGKNGEEIAFYRRRPRRSEPRRRSQRAGSPAQADAYVEALMEGCRECGVDAAEVTPERVAAALAQEFGPERPDLAVAIPAVVRRIVGQA